VPAPGPGKKVRAPRAAPAELVDREANDVSAGMVDGTGDIPRITKHMRLPAFQYAGLDPYTWPRQ